LDFGLAEALTVDDGAAPVNRQPLSLASKSGIVFNPQSKI
jgi:hypothetical protein